MENKNNKTELFGNTYGRWTVIGEYFRRIKKQKHLFCECSCRNKKWINESNLKRGLTRSCGCVKYKSSSITHGFTKTRFYKIWAGIKTRCFNNKREFYPNYGGRGITISEEWLKFENFKDDMYESYLKHAEEYGENNTSIDRIDVNGNYWKENCKWSTWKEQSNNRRTCSTQKLFEATSPSGIIYISDNQAKFSREFGLNQGHIGACLRGEEPHHKKWTFRLI